MEVIWKGLGSHLTNFTDGLAANQQRLLILDEIKLESTSNTVEDQNIMQEEVII